MAVPQGASATRPTSGQHALRVLPAPSVPPLPSHQAQEKRVSGVAGYGGTEARAQRRKIRLFILRTADYNIGMLGRILHWPLTVGSPAAPKSNDEEVLAGLQRRDPDSIAKLYDRYGSQVYSLILDTVESRCIADDLLVQTFLRVWNRAGRIHPQHTALFPWLKSLAISCVADYLQYRGTLKG